LDKLYTALAVLAPATGVPAPPVIDDKRTKDGIDPPIVPSV